MKITLTHDDGSTEDFVNQATVDAAVATAVAAIPVGSTIETIADVQVFNTDGSTETFVPETPAA